MTDSGNEGSRRISVDLPNNLIERFDELKVQWGLRRRGAVLERLLEVVLGDDNDIEQGKQDNNYLDNKSNLQSYSGIVQSEEYNEENAIVLITSSEIEYSEGEIKNSIQPENEQPLKKYGSVNSGINLPGFVRKKTEGLRTSLGKNTTKVINNEPILHNVKKDYVDNCLKETMNHWISLYGSKPKENVVEAAMIWLARDIWSHLEGTENLPFTWKAATSEMEKFCTGWANLEPKFDRIIVIAGVLEDPFATDTLKNRIPTLVRRFVNSFKRRQNVTSFQTLESTMTIHGALKLLDLPTTAGASLSLATIREAYKSKAVTNHPDSGGSTEMMRKVNEAYQLLKELYRKK
ncbi:MULTISPECIES: molecular chaperone DnaJ [Prochlorococcus]|uniref:molecular chaperone DnaJ n=1 Tax=Prochlorococcus TaxID=1218 RepID=UPI0005336F8D|nr:putative DnaJ domain [Prochlorococcus sp. MIT 0601]